MVSTTEARSAPPMLWAIRAPRRAVTSGAQVTHRVALHGIGTAC
jgi:hypothetical protein